MSRLTRQKREPFLPVTTNTDNLASVWNSKRILIIALFIIFLMASIPLLSRRTFYGDDLEFHLFRISGIVEGLRGGQFPVRMQYSQIKGYGYPVSIMYGDWLLYIPAFLNYIGFSVTRAFKLFCFLENMVIVFTSYAIFRRVFSTRLNGLLATALWTFCTYRLLCFYTRAAVGEFDAMLFFPVLLYGIWSCLCPHKEGASKFGGIWCAIALTGILTSHILSVLIVGFAMVPILIWIVCFNSCARLWKQFAICIGVTLLLSISFLMPFLDYSRKVDFAVYAIPPAFKLDTMARLAVEPSQLMTLFQPLQHGGAQAFAINFPYSIGWAVLGVVLVWFIVCFCTKANQHMLSGFETGTSMALLISSGMCLVMTSTLIPWKSSKFSFFLKLFATIQFPWRFLGILTFLLIVLGMIGVAKANKNPVFGSFPRYITVGLLILSCIECGASTTSFMNYASKYTFPEKSDTVKPSEIMNGEYLHKGTNLTTAFALGNEKAKPKTHNLALSRFSNKDANISGYARTGNIPGSIIMPKLHYPNYQVSCSKKTPCSLDTTGGDTNLIILRIPSYFKGTFHISYQIPLIWRIGDFITGLSWILLLCFAGQQLFKKRTGRRPKHCATEVSMQPQLQQVQ